MYENFYNLKEKPFQITPNPIYLYRSTVHENALTYLEYGLRESLGFILLTGPVGTGKTTLLRHIVRQFEAEKEIGVIFNTNVTVDELIYIILQSFGLGSEGNNKPQNLLALSQFLTGNFAKNRQILLIIDEAQNLTDKALEEIRMISNIQRDNRSLLQIMLVGQSELKTRLQQPVHVSFAQRIAVNIFLSRLNIDETRSYIAYRLQKAGGRPDIFGAEAIELIHEFSRGVPRAINLICDTALVYGFADELEAIGVSVIEEVIADKVGIGMGVDAETGDIPSPTIMGHETNHVGQVQIEKVEDALQLLLGKVDSLSKQVQDNFILNDAPFKFCGQCGHSLLTTGCVDLDQNGLMSRPDSGFMEILQASPNDLRGKPFSLLVQGDDLVVFFSHWNELLRSRQEQKFEIGLKSGAGGSLQVQMVLTIDKRPLSGDHAVKVSLVDISDRRYALDQVQTKQERLNLIYTITDELHTAHQNYQERTINEILKRICLLEECDFGFVYCFDCDDKVLNIRYQWRRPKLHKQIPAFKTVPMENVRRLVDRLRLEKMMVVNRMSEISAVERDMLDQWIHSSMDAFVCHLLYQQHQPIGLIGIARLESANVWNADSVALIKLVGQLISNVVFAPAKKRSKLSPKSGRRLLLKPEQRYGTIEPELVFDQEILAGDAGSAKKKTAGKKQEGQLRFDTRILPTDGPAVSVHKRNDGLILLSCPKCGFQQAVSTKPFEENGKRQTAICPHGHRFEVVRELRSMYRKPVELDGFYFQMGVSGSDAASDSVLGRMVIKDLSRTGIRFIADKPPTFHEDDQLMVKFMLDNSNRSMIKKPVVVRSINGSHVGCQFASQDRHDVTLGFYFS